MIQPSLFHASLGSEIINLEFELVILGNLQLYPINKKQTMGHICDPDEDFLDTPFGEKTYFTLVYVSYNRNLQILRLRPQASKLEVRVRNGKHVTIFLTIDSTVFNNHGMIYRHESNEQILTFSPVTS